jgi:ankyrin repeat protein
MQNNAQPKNQKPRKFFSRPNHDLRAAIKRGDLQGVADSLAKGALVNGRGFSLLKPPLALAAKYGHKHIVEYLLDRDADIEVQDGQCCTPLIVAAAHKQTEIVKLLLERGAKVNAIGGQECTALIAAVMRRSPETVKVLVAHGADMDVRGCLPMYSAKRTAMVWAQCEGYSDIIEILEAPGRAKQAAGWVQFAEKMQIVASRERAAEEGNTRAGKPARRAQGFVL